jgi:multiple sugar transport system permease protein
MLTRANWLGEFFKHSVLLAGAFVVLVPFYLMLSYSLKSPHEIEANVGGFVGSQEIMTDQRCVKAGNPEEDCKMRPIVYNYTAAFKEAPLVRYMLNGVFITVSIFIIQVIVALPCAYALSKLKFWGRDVVFCMVIFCLLIPVHAIALPLYIMLAKVGLTNTYGALIIPWSISVFGIFLMRQFFMTVPDDLIDAARMDGMSEFSIVWQVMLPTAIPALLAFGIFVTGNKDLMTPPLGLRMFKSDMDGNEYGPMMAATTVIVMPLVIVFLLAQRRFIEGITMTGMK